MRLQLGERKKERQLEAKVRQLKYDKSLWSEHGFTVDRFKELRETHPTMAVRDMVKMEQERLRPKAGGLRITESKPKAQ